MKMGKITAKLRDAVKVCFMVDGEEVKRFKNIEMPDALKELEMRDFHFDVQTDGKIEFHIHFDQGILPEEWPELRERKTRAAKAGEVAPEATEAAMEPEVAPEATEAAMEPEVAPEVTEAAMEPERAKRGRKPGKRTKAEQPQADVAM